MKPIKILIVEDNPMMTLLIKEVVVREGYEVFTATEGPGAIESARRELPELILLDVMIPKIDGFEVCRILHNDPKTSHIKIIILTALNRQVDEDAARAAGAYDFIPKPFDSVFLAQKIREAVKP